MRTGIPLAVELDPLTGGVGLGLAVKRGKAGSDFGLDGGTYFPGQGLGLAEHFAGVGGSGGKHEVGAPEQVGFLVAFGNLSPCPAAPQ